MRRVERVDRICQYCGRHFEVYPRRLKEGRGKFCCRSCANKALTGKHRATYIEKVCQQCGKRFSILASKLKWQTGEYCSQICANRVKANPLDSKVRERKVNLVSVTSQARWQTPGYRAKLSKTHKQLWQNPQFRAMMSVANSTSAKRLWQRPEYREHQIEAQKKHWENPEFLAKMYQALSRRPTKPEQNLLDILNKYLPDFKYNGDFSLGVTLGGLVPDFINVNGKKEVIEVFGDYFHSPEVLGDRWQGSELGKIAIYNSLGYKCLVIWEHELKQLTEAEIIAKVKSFFGRGRSHARV